MNAADNANARERAHQSYTLFLGTIRKVVQGDVAMAMGVSDATVSKIKNDQMQQCLTLLAHLNLKLVPADEVSMQPDAHRFLVHAHQMLVLKAPHLIFGGSEEAR